MRGSEESLKNDYWNLIEKKKKKKNSAQARVHENLCRALHSIAKKINRCCWVGLENDTLTTQGMKIIHIVTHLDLEGDQKQSSKDLQKNEVTQVFTIMYRCLNSFLFSG